MTMTTCCQAALEAIMSSRRTPQAINQFQNFSAHCNSAPPLHTPTQQTTAGVLLTHQDQTMSYLKGMALEWFKPDLLSSSDPEDCPLWMDDWKEFIIELQSTFGPHNPVADAENQLDHLQMKDGQCINKYVVEFNRLTSQVRSYRDGALRHYFYSGLPDRIKDEICQEIDVCYWECKEEIQQANRHQTSTQNSSNKLTSSAPNSGHNKSAPNSTLSSKSNNNNNKKLTNASSSNPKLASKLGKDGKLTAAERKRRYDLKLCMFCGGNGHFTDKHEKKAAKNKAKAHAAKATESPLEQLGSTSGSAPKAKK
ncbi:hypothetical protein ID866_11821 [Astraeus odoratus]|nr:hypothetical protein ID866_11821 [Astraeus odoratus]